MCSDRCKTMVVDRKYRKALALLCLTSEPLPNAANSSDVLWLDSILRELRKLLCYDKHGCFSWTAAKTMVVERINQRTLVLLGLASGPLPNAVNSSAVPTRFAAEPTTKMKSSKANSLPCANKNFFFPLIKLFLTFVACVQTSPISFHPRKRDVCETASLIVFQYPAVRVWNFA